MTSDFVWDTLTVMRLSGRISSHIPRWRTRHGLLIVSLIAINLVAFLVQNILQFGQPGFVRRYLGLSGDGIDQAYAWQFFTAILLHVNFWQVAANGVALYVIGRDVESIIGQKHFLSVYFGGAFGGELGHLFFMPQNTVLYAASGGVAAVIAAFAVILPDMEVTNAFSFTLPVKLKAKYIAYALLLAEAFLFIFSRHGTVAHSACLGGAIVGWCYAHLLGFGRPSFFQRALRHHRADAQRRQEMSFEQFIAAEIDPLLEKISRNGLASLSRRERRILSQVQAKLTQPPG